LKFAFENLKIVGNFLIKIKIRRRDFEEEKLIRN
jgi:hypothetical protein